MEGAQWATRENSSVRPQQACLRDLRNRLRCIRVSAAANRESSQCPTKARGIKSGAGLVAFVANPHHRRAQLVVLTEKGKQAFDAAMRLQAPWINSLSEGLLVKDIETMHRVITALHQKLGATNARLARRT